MPSISRSVVLWITGRLLALGALMGASGLLYHVATSPAYDLTDVRLSGNHLLSRGEAEAALSLPGANAMMLRRAEAVTRLEALPQIASADVQVILPNRVEVRVEERIPVAVWRTETGSYLVARDGVVLGGADGVGHLPVVHDVDAPGLVPGARIDPELLAGASLLHQSLRDWSGLDPEHVIYSRAVGLEVQARGGPRVRLGDGRDLDWKIEALNRIRQHLNDQRASAELIDVRFRDRPYFR